MKFLSPEVALYLCKSTIQPCMEYCFHVWAGAPSFYLDMLDKLQKHICQTSGPSLTASLEPLAHNQNLAGLVFSISITLVDVHLNWLNWFHILVLNAGQLIILIGCMISVAILRCYKDAYVKSVSSYIFILELVACRMLSFNLCLELIDN